MKNSKNIIYAIAAIVLIVILIKVPFSPSFAIVTKTYCADDTEAYWDFEGDTNDGSTNLNSIINNYGVEFVTGKLGSGMKFNTTNYLDIQLVKPINNSKTTVMWINDGTNWNFYALAGTVTYVNGVVSTTETMMPISSTFGFGTTVIVDEIAVFEKTLTQSQIIELYNAGSAKKVCNTVSRDEELSCKDYAYEVIGNTLDGCINYSGTSFPNCNYQLLVNQFYIANNQCQRNTYCELLTARTFYSTNESCKQALTYSCYIISGGACVVATSYNYCVTGSHHDTLALCNAAIGITGTTTTATETLSSTSTDTPVCIFEFGNMCVTINWVLLVFAGIIILIFFVTREK